MSALSDLRIEVVLMEAIIDAARDVVDEWRVRGDHSVHGLLGTALKIAIDDLDEWTGTE